MVNQHATAATKARILDAAENLFADNGFRGTTLRAITTKAGVNLAAVNYHFGSKEDLLAAVLDRRLGPLNRQRLAKLDQVLAAAAKTGRLPAPRDILHAFFEPTLRFRESEPGARACITIITRAITSAETIVRDEFLKQIEPMGRRLLAAMQAAYPGLPSHKLYMQTRFCLAAMQPLMMEDNMARMAPPDFKLPHELDRQLDILLDFCCQGLGNNHD